MKERIISSFVMFAVFIPFLIIGELPFTIFMALLGICALYELIDVRETRKEFPMLLKIIGFIVVAYLTVCNLDVIEFNYVFDYRIVAIVLFLFLTPMVFIHDYKKYNLEDAWFLIGSIVFIGLSTNLIVMTRNFDIKYIIYLFMITIFSDTFALITGSLVGKHKLCPNISPKKTIEGLVGGVIMGTFVSAAFYHTVINPELSLVVLVSLTIILCLVGQLGDLVFSSIKRYYDVKDFSNFIPGHGGVLDRFDSLIFVVFAFILMLGIL